MTIGLPCHPPRLNELMRGKLRGRMALSKSWNLFVSLVWGASGLPRATAKRRVTITIVLGRGQRGADPDAYFKAMGDALVACGALRGDSKEHVEWAATRYERGTKPACRIDLEDVPDD